MVCVRELGWGGAGSVSSVFGPELPSAFKWGTRRIWKLESWIAYREGVVVRSSL